MSNFRLAALVAVAACGPETTSFRTTDKGDGSERAGPPAAAYDVHAGALSASVHVWSICGSIGTSDEPMTHVGFEIRNTSHQPITFDGDALQLIALDRQARPVRTPQLVAVTPLGPAQVPIAVGATVFLDAYFMLPVRPRVVDTMRVRWSLRLGDQRYDEDTGFTRDDDYPVLAPPAEMQSSTPSS